MIHFRYVSCGLILTKQNNAEPLPSLTDRTMDPPQKKKIKLSNSTPFAVDISDDVTVQRFRTGHINSKPFKHALIDTVFEDSLLRSVCQECTDHLCFTLKETDIYKVTYV